MNKLEFYARKPAACSSPIVQMIQGKLYRVHDGHTYGRQVAVSRSIYPADLSVIAELESNNTNNNSEESIFGKE